MSNYSTQLQLNNEILNENNIDLQNLIDQANALPEVENLDAEVSEQTELISEQDTIIADLTAALVDKAGGSAKQLKTCHVVIDCQQVGGSTTEAYSPKLFYTQLNDNGEIEYKEQFFAQGKIFDIPKMLCNSRIYFIYGANTYGSYPIISNTNVIKTIKQSIGTGMTTVLHVADIETTETITVVFTLD